MKAPKRGTKKEYKAFEFLTKEVNKKKIAELIWELVKDGPLNNYELARVLKKDIKSVSALTKRLSGSGLLKDYRPEPTIKKPGSKHMAAKRVGKQLRKHEKSVPLWDLSISGIWFLLNVDEKAGCNWATIKEKYLPLMGGHLQYFELMQEIGYSKDFGYITHYTYPTAAMVADALIFIKFNEEKIESVWRECSNNTKAEIRNEIKKKRRKLNEFVERCLLLEERFQRSID
jgi:DNA-binding Lrp family transcriptional regulator